MDLSLSDKETCFLWGPRQTGKSTLLKNRYSKAPYYDLLLSDQYRRFLSNPSLLRQECAAKGLTGAKQRQPVIIDEVQKVPALLDEIHWLIKNRGIRFILCGSSPRKLKRSHANLLGGRGVRYELFPLTYPEIPGFSLARALNQGLLPRHYLSSSPAKLIQSYVGGYLQEEIAAEALTRNIPAFNRFLEVAALANNEMVNYKNIASDCGVSSPTIKGFYQILEETLIGHFIPAYRRQVKRRLIRAPKFVFFDLGVVAHLTRRGIVREGSELFNRAFEHFITLEIIAHSAYSENWYMLSCWRTASRFEVDLVLGAGQVAVEIKATPQAADRHLRGLRAFKEEHPKATGLLVSLDPRPRRTEDGIWILPWQEFLDRLWGEKII